MNENGYPLYQWCKPEYSDYYDKIGRVHEVIIDNKWVVAYCPIISKISVSHINVEFHSLVKAIKYICKYINKERDLPILTFVLTVELDNAW